MYRVSSWSSRGLLFHRGDKSQVDILAKRLHSQGTRKSALQSGAFLFCLSINLGTRNGPGASPSPSLPLWRNGVGATGKGGRKAALGWGRRAQGRALGLPWFCHQAWPRSLPLRPRLPAPARTPTQALLLPLPAPGARPPPLALSVPDALPCAPAAFPAGPCPRQGLSSDISANTQGTARPSAARSHGARPHRRGGTGEPSRGALGSATRGGGFGWRAARRRPQGRAPPAPHGHPLPGRGHHLADRRSTPRPQPPAGSGSCRAAKRALRRLAAARQDPEALAEAPPRAPIVLPGDAALPFCSCSRLGGTR